MPYHYEHHDDREPGSDHDPHHLHEHAHQEHGHEHLGEEEHRLVHFRQAKDDFMRQPQSPLPQAERARFEGLSYFPHNPELRLTLPLHKDVFAEPVTMETSTGDQQELRRAGKIRFEVEGQAVELTLYGDERGELFLPLRDATSGKESYGAGRYLEPELGDAGTVHVDFNYLYNPYCAYNDAYSCPLPPVENWLKVPIRAGERTYSLSGS